MSQQEFDTYLSLLSKLLRIAPQQREQVADEFRAHMEDRLEELLARGYSREAAVKMAVEEFGDAAALAANIVSISRNRRRRWVMRISMITAVASVFLVVMILAIWPGQQNGPRPVVAQQGGAPLAPAVVALNADARIEAALSKEVELSFVDKPLSEVIREIQKIADVPVVVRKRKLEEASINLAQPVTFEIKQVSLRSALRILLEDLGLMYVVRDEAVQITTPEDVASELFVRVYDCRELYSLPPVSARRDLKPVADDSSSPPAPGAPAPPQGGGGTLSSARTTVPDDVVQLLLTTVDVDSWDGVGGPGSAYEYKGLVVVSQTADVHEKIEKVLNMVHDAAGLERKSVRVAR